MQKLGPRKQKLRHRRAEATAMRLQERAERPQVIEAVRRHQERKAAAALLSPKNWPKAGSKGE